MKEISFIMKINMGVFNNMATKTLKKINKKIIKKTNKVSSLIKQKKEVKKVSILKKIFSLKIKNKSKLKKKTPVKKSTSDVKKESIKLKRSPSNPIIKPSLYSWESQATFNPSAFEHNGKVHLIYRAIGEGGVSSLGYAGSYDGLNIEDRPTYFIYKRIFNPSRNLPKINYNSGGGNGCGWEGGCEDPRLVLIDDIVYMIYTAFDGWNSIRIALTSISLNDFKKKRWNWKNAVFLSPPGEINKNWVIFPEKINGKYAILHSISPDILINYVDSFDEFNGKNFIESIHQNHPKWPLRERGIRGVGPTPIKTKDGWLVLYHKTEEHDSNKYKLFAMLLDLKDPTKILHKSNRPILEPNESYEQEGYRGIVYSCGAVIKNKDLIVYYGGGDKYVCVASVKLEDLLDDFKKDKDVKLRKSNKTEIK